MPAPDPGKRAVAGVYFAALCLGALCSLIVQIDPAILDSDAALWWLAATAGGSPLILLLAAVRVAEPRKAVVVVALIVLVSLGVSGVIAVDSVSEHKGPGIGMTVVSYGVPTLHLVLGILGLLLVTTDPAGGLAQRIVRFGSGLEWLCTVVLLYFVSVVVWILAFSLPFVVFWPDLIDRQDWVGRIPAWTGILVGLVNAEWLRRRRARKKALAAPAIDCAS